MPTSLLLNFVSTRLPTYLIKDWNSKYAIVSKYRPGKLEFGWYTARTSDTNDLLNLLFLKEYPKNMVRHVTVYYIFHFLCQGLGESLFSIWIINIFFTCASNISYKVIYTYIVTLHLLHFTKTGNSLVHVPCVAFIFTASNSWYATR